MHEIMKNVQAHVPFRLLAEGRLPLLLERGINPEISFNCADLDNLDRAALEKLSRLIADAGLRTTFHAPFMDLRPGAIDPAIREASRKRLRQVFDLVPYFRPLTVVCHPSFDGRYYVSSERAWLSNSIETWQYFAGLAEKTGTLISLENVYETGPEIMEQLFQALNSPHMRFCFDTGHFNVFSLTPLEVWMDKMAPYLGQVHIHDNHGEADEHLPLGAGNFPFPLFFDLLRRHNLRPLITLEVHREAHLWQSAENLGKMNPWPEEA